MGWRPAVHSEQPGATETVAFVDQRDGFLRGLKVNAFQWIVDEVSNKVDPNMVGGQIVSDMAVNDDVKMRDSGVPWLAITIGTNRVSRSWSATGFPGSTSSRRSRS